MYVRILIPSDPLRWTSIDETSVNPNQCLSSTTYLKPMNPLPILACACKVDVARRADHKSLPIPSGSPRSRHYSSAIVLDSPGDLHRHLVVKYNAGTDVNYPALMLLRRQRVSGICGSNCRGKIGTNIEGTERRACGECFQELLQ